jgi:hypothetical protein
MVQSVLDYLYWSVLQEIAALPLSMTLLKTSIQKPVIAALPLAMTSLKYAYFWMGTNYNSGLQYGSRRVFHLGNNWRVTRSDCQLSTTLQRLRVRPNDARQRYVI